MMVHTFPRWKYGLLLVCITLGLIYSLPNLYGEDPAIQIKSGADVAISKDTLRKVNDILANVRHKSVEEQDDSILVRFFSTEAQLSMLDDLKYGLGDDYTVALNLAPSTPQWLRNLGADPMKLGLDLRGGVRFLMEVDVSGNIKRRVEGDFNELRIAFRQEKIRYLNFMLLPDNEMSIDFETIDARKDAADLIAQKFPHLAFVPHATEEKSSISALIKLNPQEILDARNYTMEQTASTLRNRVNELGVAEAIVQRQGKNRVIVELPGIQDTARAKEILGKTATVDFVLRDDENDVNQALQGKVPPGSRIVYHRDGYPVLVKRRVILTGDSIVSASSRMDNEQGSTVVAVRIGGAGTSVFKDTTLKSIGKKMAVVYRETKFDEVLVDDEIVKQKHVSEEIISIATIKDPLRNNFVITGLNLHEARDLALLLRAGALPAAISIVEEHIIGPSMGQENIEKGVISVIVGVSAVLVFMAVYYSLFGMIANIALLCNLIFLLAIMSLIGATLTLPGIAGIVLTLGMAVDANVLIFERIREELRLGMTPHASIIRGFEHAFATIVDANLTTLIVGLILFAIGSGPVKGFAITLSIGILTSMFTSITGTRAMVEFLYGRLKLKKIYVGI